MLSRSCSLRFRFSPAYFIHEAGFHNVLHFRIGTRMV